MSETASDAFSDLSNHTQHNHIFHVSQSEIRKNLPGLPRHAQPLRDLPGHPLSHRHCALGAGRLLARSKNMKVAVTLYRVVVDAQGRAEAPGSGLLCREVEDGRH